MVKYVFARLNVYLRAGMCIAAVFILYIAYVSYSDFICAVLFNSWKAMGWFA
jgi:hypothetical protein